MAPRIRQVQIQNYKSIERAVVDLEPFTAFVGPNGAGKSNFVDALAFVQECVSASLDRAMDARGSTSVFSRTRGNGQDQKRLGFRLLVELAEDHVADYSFEIGWQEDHPQIARERCLIRAGDQKEWMFEIADGAFIQPIPGIRSQVAPGRFALYAASATDEFRPLYDFLTSLRVYNVEPRRLRMGDEVHLGEYLDRDGSNAAAVLKRLQEGDPQRQQRVRELLAVALPGLQNVSYSQVPGSGGGLMFQLSVGQKESVTFFERDVSDGTLRILGLLLAVYQPQKPSVLIVEEPEVTVHPAISELVIQILFDAAHDRQVLITTHSPDLLDAKELSDEQIRVVTMEQGRTIIAPLSGASRNAIRERLYTPGELLRIDELTQDIETAREASQRLDLFGATPAPVSL